MVFQWLRLMLWRRNQSITTMQGECLHYKRWRLFLFLFYTPPWQTAHHAICSSSLGTGTITKRCTPYSMLSFFTFHYRFVTYPCSCLVDKRFISLFTFSLTIIKYGFSMLWSVVRFSHHSICTHTLAGRIVKINLISTETVLLLIVKNVFLIGLDFNLQFKYFFISNRVLDNNKTCHV